MLLEEGCKDSVSSLVQPPLGAFTVGIQACRTDVAVDKGQCVPVVLLLHLQTLSNCSLHNYVTVHEVLGDCTALLVSE